ncbi:MAG: hypothetical protein QOJ94_2274 [Sphingomonadales bacterium]|jgi:hypothetical protein|nr:hypothetical protein [Sphingomonadales bacterium]
MDNLIRVGLGLLALTAGPAIAQTGTPYQHQGAINTPQCTSNQCIITFPAVPAGKRLVLASVSAQVGSLPGFVLEGSGATYFVPKANPANGMIAQPITLYYSAGQQPTARIFAPPGTPSTSIIVTLVGQLQPAP